MNVPDSNEPSNIVTSKATYRIIMFILCNKMVYLGSIVVFVPYINSEYIFRGKSRPFSMASGRQSKSKYSIRTIRSVQATLIKQSTIQVDHTYNYFQMSLQKPLKFNSGSAPDIHHLINMNTSWLLYKNYKLFMHAIACRCMHCHK